MAGEFRVEGGCMCGAVRFALLAPPVVAGYCHCTRCQRRTGSGASAQARIDGDSLVLLSGEDQLAGWRHPDGGMEKCFCRTCGAHVFSRRPDDGRPLAIRMAAFDEDPGIRPSFRQYVAYAPAWEQLPDDGLPRFAEAKPH